MSAPFICVDCDDEIYNPVDVYQYVDEWGDLVHPVCHSCYNLARGFGASDADE